MFACKCALQSCLIFLSCRLVKFVGQHSWNSYHPNGRNIFVSPSECLDASATCESLFLLLENPNTLAFWSGEEKKWYIVSLKDNLETSILCIYIYVYIYIYITEDLFSSIGLSCVLYPIICVSMIISIFPHFGFCLKFPWKKKINK